MSKVILAVFYILKYFCLNIVCQIIPHPKLRAFYLKFLGAKIGKNVRIENVKFIQIQNSIKNLSCGVDSFIGTGVILDLSDKITIGSHVGIAAGSTLITHQDMSALNTKLLSIYPKLFAPIVIGDDVVIFTDTTIVPGSTIEDFTVIGAKSLVKGYLKGNNLYVGIPAKCIKPLPFSSK